MTNNRAVQEAFQRVKADILSLQNQMNHLMRRQEELYREFSAKSAVKQTVIRAKPNRSKFVASKTASKFHVEQCPFAKNIKPKAKITYLSKVKALNEGYKPCSCVQK